MNRTKEIELLTNPAVNILMKNNYVESYVSIHNTTEIVGVNFNKEYFN